MDISKIQAGKVVVETIHVDPLEMVNEVAQLMRVRTDAKALQLNVEFVGGIVAPTAHAMAGDRAKCISAGCDDYTTKPINRKELVCMVRRHLEHRTEGVSV